MIYVTSKLFCDTFWYNADPYSECSRSYTQTHTHTARLLQRAGNSRRIISEMDISSVSVCASALDKCAQMKHLQAGTYKHMKYTYI